MTRSRFFARVGSALPSATLFAVMSGSQDDSQGEEGTERRAETGCGEDSSSGSAPPAVTPAPGMAELQDSGSKQEVPESSSKTPVREDFCSGRVGLVASGVCMLGVFKKIMSISEYFKTSRKTKRIFYRVAGA